MRYKEELHKLKVDEVIIEEKIEGVEYTIGGWSQVISSFDWVPLGVVFASIPFGSSIMVLISFQIVLHQILVIYDHEKFNEFRIKTAKDRGVEE